LLAAVRRPLAATTLVAALAGAVVGLAAAPADAAALKPHPHATTAASAPAHHHGGAHGKPGAAHHRAATPKHGPTPGAPRLKPRTAPAAAWTAPAVRPAEPSWVAPSAPPERPTAPAPMPAAAPKPHPAATRISTWQREDTGPVDRGVVRAFATDLKQAGQAAGFPALLVAVMVVFLLVQHRVDKRDVKLSHADWASDQGLEFSAPATIRR
jgi:hypothetical protein